MLNIKIERTNHGEVAINGDQFRLFEMFMIPGTYNYPYKLMFYELSGAVDAVDEGDKKISKVLCIVRGSPHFLLDKVYGNVINLGDFSKRMHEEKGFHTEVLCKLTLNHSDFEQIRNTYESGNISLDKFYSGLERYFVNM